MNEKTRTELEAAAFRQLVEHLRERKDVQNIDLMNLAGFCRNCLSKWYRAAAEERGLELSDADARKIVYGMPYDEWKAKHQQGDDCQTYGQANPYADPAPAVAERQPGADANTDHPVADEGEQHRHPRIVQPAQHPRADHLRAVGHLEDGGDAQECNAELDDPGVGGRVVDRSLERRPASTCPTGICNLEHTSAAATVELTSP